MFAKEGYTTIAVILAASAVIAIITSQFDHWTTYLVYAALIIVVGLTLNFFRDPDRDTPEDEGLIVAPADGTVIEVKPVQEDIFLKGKGTQVSIFLSLFDVHVNRIPVTGTVEYEQYHPGKYLVAWHEKSSELNERAEFGIKHASGTPVFFRQIAGFVARRIVYHIKKRDHVNAGDRFGMMKFGSRMDIIVPKHVEIDVEEGDRAIGGKSILGRIQKENHEISDTETAKVESR